MALLPMKTIRSTLAAVTLSALALPATAQVFTMDFDGAKPPAQGTGIAAAPGLPGQNAGSAVLGYYNGDPGFNRVGNQAWNTTFGSSALAIGSLQDPDGQGNFPTAHSGWWAVGSVASPSLQFDISPGLRITELAFWYNAGGAGSNPGVAVLAGNQLVFSASLDECTSPGSGGFCGWKQYSFDPGQLSGNLVTRVTLSGTPNKVVFDDIAVTAVPVPEPASYALMALGLMVVTAFGRRKR